jgi:predicted Zn-dependent protease
MEAGRIDALKGMLEKSPKDAMLHYFLGNEYFKVGRYGEAIEAIRAYLSLAEDEGAAYRTLAQSLERIGKISEAQLAYRQGIDAASRYGHPGMAAEFEAALKELA